MKQLKLKNNVIVRLKLDLATFEAHYQDELLLSEIESIRILRYCLSKKLKELNEIINFNKNHKIGIKEVKEEID